MPTYKQPKPKIVEPVTFKSKYLLYRMVIEPSDYDIIGRHKVRVPGKEAQFKNGLFTTNGADIIKAMKEHRNYGIDYIEVEKQHKIADNPLPVEPEEPAEPPVVKPQRRGARSTKDIKN